MYPYFIFLKKPYRLVLCICTSSSILHAIVFTCLFLKWVAPRSDGEEKVDRATLEKKVVGNTQTSPSTINYTT